MAKDKKSFILYLDQRGMFDKLSNEQAGILIKHIFSYCSDENPECDFITELAFEPIKMSLKRDLKKYESIRNRNSINGSMGGRPKTNKEPKKPTGLFGNPKEPKKPVSDSVSVSVSDSDSEIKKIYKKNQKKVFNPPTISELKEYFKEKGYNEQTAQKMFDSYDVADWKDSRGNKIKNWKQKAINVWFTDDNKIQENQTVSAGRPKMVY